MNVDEVCETLKPHFPEAEKLRRWHIAASPETKRLIETRLDGLLHQLGDAPSLAPPNAEAVEGEYVLGTVECANKPFFPFGLREEEWVQHVSVFGRSGAGKTNLVNLILWNFLKHGKPFMVFDWKRNYRDLLAVKGTEAVVIFTVGRDVRPFRFNPWLPPPGMSNLVWTRKLIDVLCHAYFAGEGVSDVLTQAAEKAYQANEKPLSKDVMYQVELSQEKSRQAQWKASSLRILRALSKGVLGEVLSTESNEHLELLLQLPVVLELDALADADKTFLIETLLLWIHHYRMAGSGRETFKHVIVIEEAHHVLLKQPLHGTEAITDVVMREIRELGESIVVIDQHPSLLSLPALGNTNTTICFNLKHRQDVDAAAASLLLPRKDYDILGKLEVGVAVAKMQGRVVAPFLIRIPRMTIPKGMVTDDMLRGEVARTVELSIEGVDFQVVELAGGGSVKIPCLGSSTPKWPPLPERNEVQEVCSSDSTRGVMGVEEAFLQSIIQEPLLQTLERYSLLGLSRYQGNKLRNELVARDLLEPLEILTRRGRVILYRITKQAKQVLSVAEVEQPGLEHRFWVAEVSQCLTATGYEVAVEEPIGSHVPDIVARRDGEVIVVEVETGKSDIAGNYRRAWLLNADRVVVLATSISALSTLRRVLPADAEVMLAKDFFNV